MLTPGPVENPVHVPERGSGAYPDPGLELALTCSHPPIAHLVGVVMGERCDRCPQGPWPWLTGGKWQGEVV